MHCDKNLLFPFRKYRELLSFIIDYRKLLLIICNYS
jgi:hypothetical protein